LRSDGSSGAPEIETERLILRGMRRDDFDAHAALWADPQVTRFIGGKPLTREEAWNSFVRYFGMWALLGFGFWAVTDKATGRLVGEAGFQERMRDIDPSIEGTIETGWTILPEAHGQGLASETVVAMLAWADRVLPDKRITCLIAPQNTASMRVAHKNGFRAFARADYQGGEVVLLERTKT